MKQLTIKLKAALLCLALLWAWSPLQAEPPQKVSFQGRLTDTSDAPLNGTYNITFSLYDSPSGGTVLWTETQNSVSVVNGALDTELGASNPIAYSAAAVPSYLEISVDGDTLYPRQSFNSVLYSYNSYALGGYPAAAYMDLASSQTVTGVKTFSVNPVFNVNAIPQSAVSGLESGLSGLSASTASLQSQIDGISTGDNLGDHVASMDLNMSSYSITNAYNVTAAYLYGDGSGLTGVTGTGDNLGNHTATMPLNMNSNPLIGVSSMAIAGGPFVVMTGTATDMIEYGGSMGLGTGAPGLGATAAYGNILHIYDDTPFQYPGIFIEDSDAPGARWFVHAHGDGRNSFAIRDDVNGFEPLYIENSLVGIGTDDYTPLAQLHVLSSAPVDNLFLASNGPYLSTNHRFVIKGNGNVGLGTLSPNYQLVIDGTTGYAGAMVEISTGGTGVITMYGNGDVVAGKFYGDGSGLTGVTASGDGLGIHVATTTLDMAGYGISNISSMSVSGSFFSVGGSTLVVKNGKVGIGRNPMYFFDVAGQGVFLNQVDIRTLTGPAMLQAPSGTLNINTAAGGDLVLQGNGTPRAIFKNGGNVGIGTQTPAYRLVVSTGAGETGTVFAVETGTAAVARINGLGQVYATSFHGDGSGLSGVTASGAVLKTGDTMTGPLVISGSALTVNGNAAFTQGDATINLYSSASIPDIRLQALSDQNVFVRLISGSVEKADAVYSKTLRAMVLAHSELGVSNPASRKDLVIKDGYIGISTGAPQAALDILAATGTYVQIWRDAGGTAVASMTATGKLYADGSGLTGIVSSGTADNLGNHTATQNLDMSSNVIVNALAVYGGYFYGDGSNLTGITSTGTADNLGNHIATQDLDMSSNSISGVNYLTASGVDAAGGQLTVYDGTTTYLTVYNGNVGIGTSYPEMPLDVRMPDASTATVIQAWRNSSGVIVASMSPTGILYGTAGSGDNLGNHIASMSLDMGGNSIVNASSVTASYFYGDGSGLTGVTGSGDNLGNHIATTTLNMNGNSIDSVGGIGVGEVNADYLNVSSYVTVDSTVGYQVNGVTLLRSSASFAGVFVGEFAGAVNTGFGNVFVGYEAGQANTSGVANTFMGLDAGYSNTTGSQNLFLGTDSGYNNSDGTANVFLGADAGYTNTVGFQNVFVGKAAGFENITGSSNTLLGYGSGGLMTIGNGNTLLGTMAGANLTTGNNNIIIGANQDASFSGENDGMNIGGVIYGDLNMGTIGIGVNTPAAALDVKSTATATMAQTWRDENNVIVSTMTSAGTLHAVALEVSTLSVVGGSAGIGTASPSGAKLVVQNSGDGTPGLRLVTTGSKPVCDATNRGSIFVEEGTPDKVYMCLQKSVASTFQWVLLALGE